MGWKKIGFAFLELFFTVLFFFMIAQIPIYPECHWLSVGEGAPFASYTNLVDFNMMQSVGTCILMQYPSIFIQILLIIEALIALTIAYLVAAIIVHHLKRLMLAQSLKKEQI